MKKLLATLLASSMALSAIGGLVACGNNDDGEEKVNPIPATAISLSKTTLEMSPDATAGLIAKLTPTNSNTEVEWKSSNPDIVEVHAGFLSAWDEGTVTITAKAGEYTATCTVTVGAWTRFAAVGSCFEDKKFDGTTNTFTDEIGNWNADTTKWIMQQDPNDKHKWTITANLPENAEFKFVPCVQLEDGTWKGGGWATSYGCDQSKANATIVEGGSEVNLAAGDNIKVEYAGNYTLTLITKAGGGVNKLTYVRNGDVVTE